MKKKYGKQRPIRSTSNGLSFPLSVDWMSGEPICSFAHVEPRVPPSITIYDSVDS
ncbi:unnamed protein product [Sphenostylis stenocarpa]|uniref:Uncharacterized protein n=1 Tax=Sphenostylis stenocarpa TaxID=92480 RepID=A0AA86SGN2_9FABA|nr:unnamed protein product [Sphenostylis stenocarpa]